MPFSPFKDPDVEAVLAVVPQPLHLPLMLLRQCILETAAETAAVGALVETLKWGEPAYLAKTPRTGTTIRINALKKSANQYAMFVPCQTSLLATFRQIYGAQLSYAGNRAIVFDLASPPPGLPLKHCIALALTYHARRQP